MRFRTFWKNHSLGKTSAAAMRSIVSAPSTHPMVHNMTLLGRFTAAPLDDSGCESGFGPARASGPKHCQCVAQGGFLLWIGVLPHTEVPFRPSLLPRERTVRRNNCVARS